MAESTAFAILPPSVVFARRKENRIAVLPFDSPQPNRSLRVLRRTTGMCNSALAWFAGHIMATFDDLKHLIKRHGNAILWGR